MDALSAVLFVIIFVILGWSILTSRNLQHYAMVIFLTFCFTVFAALRTPFYGLQTALGFFALLQLIAIGVLLYFESKDQDKQRASA